MKNAGKRRSTIHVGAPEKPEEDKKAPNGLTNAQWERFKTIASNKRMSAASLLSTVAQWYLDALDRSGANTDAHAMFDDTLRKEGVIE